MHVLSTARRAPWLQVLNRCTRVYREEDWDPSRPLKPPPAANGRPAWRFKIRDSFPHLETKEGWRLLGRSPVAYCTYFQSGKCNRGDYCSFHHVCAKCARCSGWREGLTREEARCCSTGQTRLRGRAHELRSMRNSN